MNEQVKKLETIFSLELGKEKVFSGYIDLLSKGTDASFYRLVPQLVVRIESESEAAFVIKSCQQNGVPLTFKAGGTSLSGQTITDSVLMEIGDLYSKTKIKDDGTLATFECGITGGLANQRLLPFGRKLGPSPASIKSARIGGIVANNASGSSYGIKHNSYNTIRSMRLLLADGTLLDTGCPASREAFEESHQNILANIKSLSQEVKGSNAMVEKINHKYQLKNTCGYGVNSLVDFDDPIDIIQQLMIGSEGTLGFISEVTLQTVKNHPLKAASLIFLPNIVQACKAIPALRQCNVSAAELMDYNALKAVAHKPNMPFTLEQLDSKSVALLVDTSADDVETLERQIDEIARLLEPVETIMPISFTTDPTTYSALWRVREGLFPSAASSRPAGTACIIEDLAFRADVLSDALVDLKGLLEKTGYDDYVIWGHLLDGNIHFTIMPDFNKPNEIGRYEKFMKDLAGLTLMYDGSLKAEHGTGRNMAPFVEQEWGSDIYGVMKQIKRILDPNNILNPGVLINDDPKVHLANMKSLPPANEIIDTCIECGFCEPTCPSKDLSLTPRQRIVVYRRMVELANSGTNSDEYKMLKKGFEYGGNATCATDGLCELNCPVEINTGSLIKQLRFNENGNLAKFVAGFIASNFAFTTSIARFFLNIASIKQKIFGKRILVKITRFLNHLLGTPVWNPLTPKGANGIKPKIISEAQTKVVYFPSCINRTFGTSVDYPDKRGVAAVTVSLIEKAGFGVIIPERVNTLCCGMAFSSKGFRTEAKKKSNELEAALLKASENGKYPIACEMSPCLMHMKDTLTKNLQLLEPVEFSLKYLLPKLKISPVEETITVHSTCSTTKMGFEKDLHKLASICASKVVVPDQVGCCGWAGDKGFTHSELNKAALRHLKTQLPKEVKSGYSTSRTCEIGLSSESGINYRSILFLIDMATHQNASQGLK